MIKRGEFVKRQNQFFLKKFLEFSKRFSENLEIL